MARGALRSAYGETRLVSEYLAAQYPSARTKERVRLGPVVALTPDSNLSEADLKMVGVFRRFADAVAITPNELVLIEGKMRSNPSAVAQLLLYQELVPLTFELYDYLSLPLVLEMVVAVDDPAVRRMAERAGIRVQVYRPDWLPQWVAAVSHREAVPHRDFVAMAANDV